ncbi:cobalt-precorrin-5B (C(1))-methyltransferase CbiD [Oleidesulfovibrio sp.]|uniref:cobalt-precorrin-5B (C(1))-methyltransferase CbiD n=1 Tax=Oleidesulfovibrio sp. TaxID=2909707 RepID=UPI003A87028B
MAKTKKLREGFTTGSSCAAAAAAALHMLLGKASCPASVSIGLPPFDSNNTYQLRRLNVPISCGTLQSTDYCIVQVIKDGGDDPDATHGCIIEIHVCLSSDPKQTADDSVSTCKADKQRQTEVEGSSSSTSASASASAPVQADLATFMRLAEPARTEPDKKSADGMSANLEAAQSTASRNFSADHARHQQPLSDSTDGPTFQAQPVVIPREMLLSLGAVLDKQTSTPCLPDNSALQRNPDQTHQARVQSEHSVTLEENGRQNTQNIFSHHASRLRITLHGGHGVGVVSLPGLPVAVGEPAINPEPRKQIAAAILEVCAGYGFSGAVDVIITVPEGKERARRTFNPRLGILGGISILGTRGTVKPYSHGAWKATITQGMDVAASCGAETIFLSTGRRSERMLMEFYPEASETAFVQVADFARFSLQAATQRSFSHIVWGCFFGKLVKLGEGHHYTHAHSAEIDFTLLAQECSHAGLSAGTADKIATANTARHALELMEQEKNLQPVLDHLTRKALVAARKHTGYRPRLTVHLFDFDGRHLAVADD